MNLLFLAVILIVPNFISSQAMPINHFLYQSRKQYYDIGENWESLSTFGPIKYDLEPKNELIYMDSSIYIDGYIGLDTKSNSHAWYGFGRIKYKKYYYGYINPSFVGNLQKNQNQYSVSTALMNNQENHSGLGYENSWIRLQIGRGKENWGAGNDIELALSENSGSYDYVFIGSDYGKIRVRYIHGFLENVEENINRYITARGFEWTNKKSLIIGFSEIAIYSGLNRSIDFGYLNPISSHLEIETNNRLSYNDGFSNNAVWQVHIDYRQSKKLRISFNYLYDEFVIDKSIQIGKEHGKAYSARLAYTPKPFSNNILTLYSSYVFVGTPTFRHKVGANNFVQNGIPLGWHGGSDGMELRIGLNYFNKRNIIASISSVIMDNGEESITGRIFDPYKDYIKGPFPSGRVQKTIYFEACNTIWWREKVSFTTAAYWSPNNSIFDSKLSVQILQEF